MIIQREGETLHSAIKRTCAERGHDFSHGSHRCWNCNILYNKLDDGLSDEYDEPLPPLICKLCNRIITEQLIVSNDGTFCSVACHKEFTKARRERNEPESFNNDFRFSVGRHIQ